MAAEKNQYLECGKIINTHGINGDLKLESWCDSPEILAGVKTLYFREKDGTFTGRRVTRAFVVKRFAVMHIEGITSPEQADALRETVVFADRKDVPLDEGDYFIADLIGLLVYDADTGIAYGTLSEVFNSGASDIYTVSTPDGERMIPAVPEFVISVDTEKGIAVRPIEGMFD